MWRQQNLSIVLFNTPPLPPFLPLSLPKSLLLLLFIGPTLHLFFMDLNILLFLLSSLVQLQASEDEEDCSVCLCLSVKLWDGHYYCYYCCYYYYYDYKKKWTFMLLLLFKNRTFCHRPETSTKPGASSPQCPVKTWTTNQPPVSSAARSARPRQSKNKHKDSLLARRI